MRYAERQREAPTLLAFPAARNALMDSLRTLPTEQIPLESARGRTLAAELRAHADLVPYARAAMDGYAVRSCDVTHTPVTLAVIHSIYAGRGDDVHTPGTATAIATGAPLPHGSDAVIPIEDVDIRGSTITVFDRVERDDHIFAPAQDASRGDVLVAGGARLDAGTLGLLAAAGHGIVDVVRKPRVAIVCTGDEIVAMQTEPGRGEVRDSNGIMLAALAADSDAEIVVQCVLRDDANALVATFERLLTQVDVLVVTGGASLGPRDFVKAALCRLDARWLFTSVAIRPGRPAAAAMVQAKPVFVLPGNPAAAFVAATLFMQPALRHLAGGRADLRRSMQVCLAREIRAKPYRHSFVFGRFVYGDGLSIVPLENQCSSLIRTAADADALIVVDPSDRCLPAGETVTVLPVRPYSPGSTYGSGVF